MYFPHYLVLTIIERAEAAATGVRALASVGLHRDCCGVSSGASLVSIPRRGICLDYVSQICS